MIPSDQARPESGDPVGIVEERVSTMSGTTIKRYARGKLLGKGGFAKCFEMTNLETKRICAGKVIPKASLTKQRAKQKLHSEIKIHRTLHHKNVVDFEHVFEDNENVYILLELCMNQTLNELMKRRKKLTDMETQCYIVQIISSLMYLHVNRVIHRDLKLGNLFLNDKMELKLGDFGLATKLEFDGEKKRTICGTPNYIAPEILDGRMGHSYEVDVWSLGVVLYTMLIGKPPFETSDVKTTYKRIRALQYTFPDNVQINEQAKHLIQQILVLEPSKRPTMREVLDSPFLSSTPIPNFMPVSTLSSAPSSAWIRQVLTSPKVLVRSASTAKALDNNIITAFESQRASLATLPRQRPSSIAVVSPPPRLGMQTMGSDFRIPNSPMDTQTLTPNLAINSRSTPIGRTIDDEVFVIRWRDLSEKFGLGYLLSNGSVGVCFNDSSKVILNPKASHFEYYEKTTDKVDVMSKFSFTTEPPPELKKKVVLLQNFKMVLENAEADKKGKTPKNGTPLEEMRMVTEPPPRVERLDDSAYLVYAKKWMKTRHAILFRLNNKLVQVIFLDFTQILLSSHHKRVIYLNKKGERMKFDLSTAMEDENKEMVKRLRYAKEILTMVLTKKGEINHKDQKEPIMEGEEEKAFG